jgi:hypothetical protein
MAERQKVALEKYPDKGVVIFLTTEYHGVNTEEHCFSINIFKTVSLCDYSVVLRG